MTLHKSRTETSFLIKEWIHSEKDRWILMRHILDGITYEKIAEEMELSIDCVKRRGRKAIAELAQHL